MKKTTLLLILIASFFSTSQPNSTEQDVTWVNVFVHGSFSLKPHLTLRNIANMLFDTVEESIYYRATEISRRDNFFHKNQAMLGLGLKKIDVSHPHNRFSAPIVAESYETISKFAGNAPSDQYYTFGWSGLVSHKLRYIEASLLHKELGEVITQLQKEGKNPKVKIISYSHGGNLALQLGAIHITKPPAEQFEIEELCLVGTPVQVETDYLINSPIFKKVYNIYSKADGVQQLDFFSFKRFFSRRKFVNRKNFKLPDKLTQVRVHITDYVPRKKESDIPFPRDEKTLRKLFKKIVYDPGHFELWFMGWTFLAYRDDFPFSPMPLIAFIPIITKYLDDDPKLSKDLIVKITPYNESMTIYNDGRMTKNKPQINRPFMPKKLLQDLKKRARTFEPSDYNIETYNKKMGNALSIAQYEYDQLKQLKTKEFKQPKNKKETTTKKSRVINIDKKRSSAKGHLN